MPREDNDQLRMAGVKQLLLAYIMIIVQMLIFFISAGHFNGLRSWVFFGALFVNYSVSVAVQYRFNPELLAQRLKRKREGSKLWDEILMRVSNLVALVPVPVIAGLDVGRFHWSTLNIYYMIVGFVFLTISTVFLNWAMVVNPFFEQTVRIQKDRGHRVIMSGPYRIVRHPGYFGGILYILSVPLILGSVFTIIPAGIYITLMIIRTLLEDRTLHKELNGYLEYATRVRYRLFPGIW